MRRRPRSGVYPEPPAGLRYFDESAGTFEEWREARHLWQAEHGWIGGAVQLMREELAVRRGEPMPPPSYPFWCPPRTPNTSRTRR